MKDRATKLYYLWDERADPHLANALLIPPKRPKEWRVAKLRGSINLSVWNDDVVPPIVRVEFEWNGLWEQDFDFLLPINKLHLLIGNYYAGRLLDKKATEKAEHLYGEEDPVFGWSVERDEIPIYTKETYISLLKESNEQDQ